MRPAFSPLRLALFFSLGLVLLPCLNGQEPTSQNNDRLRKGLQQFPEADTNKNGILTMAEGQAYMAKMRGKSNSAPSAADLARNPPTFADVAYGPHERNKLDFWKADTDKPAPVIVF